METLSHGAANIHQRGFRPAGAAAYTGMTEDWLKRARIYGEVDGIQGPKFHRISDRIILYYREDLDDFLDRLSRLFPAQLHNGAA